MLRLLKNVSEDWLHSVADVRVAVFIFVLAVRIGSSGSPLVVCIGQWETGVFDSNVVVFPSRSFFCFTDVKVLFLMSRISFGIAQMYM